MGNDAAAQSFDLLGRDHLDVGRDGAPASLLPDARLKLHGGGDRPPNQSVVERGRTAGFATPPIPRAC